MPILRENVLPLSSLLNSDISSLFVRYVLCFILVRRRTKLPFRRKSPILPNFNVTQINVIFTSVCRKLVAHLWSEAAKIRNENKQADNTRIRWGRGIRQKSGHTQCNNKRDAPNTQVTKWISRDKGAKHAGQTRNQKIQAVKNVESIQGTVNCRI
jgi:hypothetical protein